MGEFAVGQGVSRFEDPRLVRGGGRYVDDIKLPVMAHAVVARSPHAHAKIKSIDISAVKVASGVLAVLTAADVKAAGYGDLPVPGGPWMMKCLPVRASATADACVGSQLTIG